MADKKISQLTTLAQADVAVTADFLPIVDTSATETKKATPQSVVLGALGATSANVGIGTTSPSGRLHISTASGNTDFYHNVTGAGTAARTVYTRGGTVQFYAGLGAWSGTDTYQIANASGPLTTLDSSGNLGIGTASPANYANYRNLAISGTTGANIDMLSGSTKVGNLFNDATNFYAYNVIAGSLVFGTNNAEVGRFTAAGNLGLGTASPVNKLVVSNAGAQGFEFDPANGILQVYNRSTSAYGEFRPYGSLIRFFTGSSPTETARLDASGSLGIGTASPRGDVDVGTSATSSTTKSIHIGYSVNDFYGFRVANTNTAGSFYAGTFAIQRGTGSAWVDNVTVDDNANVTVGGGTLATNATNGFLYVPTCAGTPTGMPTAKTGYAPIVVNTTNNKLYFYSGGAWRDAGP